VHTGTEADNKRRLCRIGSCTPSSAADGLVRAAATLIGQTGGACVSANCSQPATTCRSNVH
jgi:hypothetical protein